MPWEDASMDGVRGLRVPEEGVMLFIFFYFFFKEGLSPPVRSTGREKIPLGVGPSQTDHPREWLSTVNIMMS